MKILGFSLIVILFLSSFDSVYEKNDYEIEDEIINIINIERIKLDLPILERNSKMDLASHHHVLYLEKLRDFLGKDDFVTESKKEIDGTPKGHFETVDFSGFEELLTPTRRVSKYTHDTDSLSCECALFLETSNKRSSYDIVNGFKSSQRHWNVLMMKDLLKYWGHPKTDIKEIGISVKRINYGGSYRNICVITTK